MDWLAAAGCGRLEVDALASRTPPDFIPWRGSRDGLGELPLLKQVMEGGTVASKGQLLQRNSSHRGQAYSMIGVECAAIF